MFGPKKVAVPKGDGPTIGIIPQMLEVNGFTITEKIPGVLRIEGTVNGPIIATQVEDGGWASTLHITGKVKSDISVSTVIIDGGKVEGNIVADHVVLKRNGTEAACVVGNITYNKLTVEAGAIITGKLTFNEVGFPSGRAPIGPEQPEDNP